MAAADRDESVRVQLAALTSEVRTGIAALHRRQNDVLSALDNVSEIAQRALSASALTEARLESRVGAIERERRYGGNGSNGRLTAADLKFYIWIASASVGGTIAFLYFIGKLT